MVDGRNTVASNNFLSGTTMSVIINMDIVIAIVVSAVVGVAYTLFGQMIAVAYTDIMQLIFIIVGLVSIRDSVVKVTSSAVY
jgi:Na+/proline symporter